MGMESLMRRLQNEVSQLRNDYAALEERTSRRPVTQIEPRYASLSTSNSAVITPRQYLSAEPSAAPTPAGSRPGSCHFLTAGAEKVVIAPPRREPITVTRAANSIPTKVGPVAVVGSSSSLPSRAEPRATALGAPPPRVEPV